MYIYIIFNEIRWMKRILMKEREREYLPIFSRLPSCDSALWWLLRNL